MQMARFFETNTLSYAIRRGGAHIKGSEMLLADTVQDQLKQNAIESCTNLPVPDRFVLVTDAGHPESNLRRRTDFKYILHVAAVRISLESRAVEPVGGLKQLLTNCFEKIEKIEADTPLESVLLPMFGTGNGGHSVAEVADKMIRYFANDLKDELQDCNSKVNKIGLSAYFKEDLDLMTGIFLEHGFIQVV